LTENERSFSSAVAGGLLRGGTSRITISKANFLHNLSQWRRLVGPKVKIMAMVKANAYGHGLAQVAPIVAAGGANWLGVNNLEEGLQLRQLGIKLPTLVLGYVPLQNLIQAVSADLSLAVYNHATVRVLPAGAKVHLKVETGTNRQGVEPQRVPNFINACRRRKIILEGIYTHFASVEDETGFAKKQLAILAQVNLPNVLRHAACSAAALCLPPSHLDMVRIGLGLYGLWSTKPQKINLKPVLSWQTTVAQVKTVSQGETVGYGRTWQACRRSAIAVLPVGYYDGYDRGLSNGGRVLVHGQFAPVIGRICMNMCMVDVTAIPNVRLEDEVVLLGRQGKNQVTAEELAEKCGTINYEIVSRLNPLIPRVVI